MLKPRRKRENEAGIYMVMLAGMLIVLITLIALFLASGFISANKTRLQNSTNFASLAAIERYVRAIPTPPATVLTYNERANIARDHANALLDRQTLLGATHSGAGSVGVLGYQGQDEAGGEMILGVWYPTKSTTPPHPCGTDPCFEPASLQPGGANVPQPSVNAVKIRVKTPHPFNVPLLGLLGFNSLDIESEAIAAVVPRCTVFVLDISSSSQEASHYGTPDVTPPWTLVNAPRPSPYSIPTAPTFTCQEADYFLYSRPHYYTCPRSLMPFAFEQENVVIDQSMGIFVDPELADPLCESPTDDIYTTTEGRIWCNLEYHDGLRRRFTSTPPLAWPPADGMRQIPEYYRKMDSPYGKVLVDTLNRPQPMSDFLLGFNAGARMMIQQSSQSDRAGILAFEGGVRYQFPQTGLSTDLGFIAQVTNADRINPGFTGDPGPGNPPREPQHPNFVDLGWFATVAGNTGSNIVAGLDGAISVLSNPNYCPEHAQKSVILATDGVMNCTYVGPGWHCAGDYSKYLDSESYLLSAGFDTGLEQDSILRRMQRSNIAFSVFIAGGSGPNIVNRFIANAGEPNNGHFVDFDEARALGMSSMPPYQDPAAVNSTVFVDSRSNDIPNVAYNDCESDANILAVLTGLGTLQEKQSACAFYRLGQPGVFFRRPLAAFYKLAVETGGWYCPFLTQGAAANYAGSTPNSKLRHDFRMGLGVNSRITVNPFNRNAGQEAAVCAQQTLGLNPFVLVREGG